MTTALFVSATEDTKTPELLRKIGVEKVVFARSGGEARRMLFAVDYYLIIINAPLADENGLDLSVSAADNSLAGILLIARNDAVEVVRNLVETEGVLVIGKPVSSAEITRSLQLLIAVHRRYMGLRKENTQLKVKLEEIRVVDRAKLLLIDALHMTENQAHKFIEKQAMDLRITRRAVAERIIKTYEQ